MLRSPTGTGKTLGFLLPILKHLEPENREVQAVILAPTRELALQIESVVKSMKISYKVNCCYGGHPVRIEKRNLSQPPAILIATPGRLADHIHRQNISLRQAKMLVLDEFDKSLEIGFESEMSEIIEALPAVEKKILTSATNEVDIPDFVELEYPKVINYLGEGVAKLKIKAILSPSKDKLETLVDLLQHLGNQPGIIFCNLKDSIQHVSDFFTKNSLIHLNLFLRIAFRWR